MRRILALAAGVGGVLIPVLFFAAPSSFASRAMPKTVARSGMQAGLSSNGLAALKQESALGGGYVTMASQTVPALLKQATRLGAHAPGGSISLTLGLRLRNVNNLKRFLRQVQDPKSPVYRHFLTPSEFTAEYGPTPDQVAAVVGFLKHGGITVKGVSPNRILIHTEASAAAYEHAFGIMINDYQLNGRTFFSTADRPRLTTQVAPIVQNVIGLNNAVVLRSFSHVGTRVMSGRSSATNAPPPASSAYYNPAQIATAYEWPSILKSVNGAGVTIAILTADSSGLSADDYNGFWSAFGLPSHTVSVIPVDGDNGSTDGTIETLLDLEWSGAMGPGANENVYVAADPSFGTFIDTFNQFVNDNTAQVMTTSWGAPESSWGRSINTADAIFMQAAAQGISMFAAAGDNGSSDGTRSDYVADYPSSSPYITASNGTELKADVNGNYESETAWSNTGGAVSQYFSEPSWQTGAGVPDNGWRNNSDMALNAGPDYPYLIRYRGNWGAVYGTSAVAPQFAGLFAIGITDNGGVSLGQSNQLIYNDVNAGNYASDFKDVTSGSNGAFDAGPDWDHPTGWGSPRAVSLLSHLGIQGPSGTVEGTVTDASTGAPISGAIVTLTPGGKRTQTDGNGHYSKLVAAGTYTVTASNFGYADQSDPVTVADGSDVEQDFSLGPAQMAKLSGHVTDGSGHGYGLYADIRITTPTFGHVADIWTDPKTGAYSVSLPKGNQYSMSVTPAFDGYKPGSANVTLSRDLTQDFVLPITTACAAPGYNFTLGGLGEDFNGRFPPSGWTVTNNVRGSSVVWNTDGYWGDQNWTGGTGAAATADSNNAANFYSYFGAYDTSLVSPLVDVSMLSANPVLTYSLNYHNYSTDALDVDISVDGGAWNTIQHLTSQNYGGLYDLPGVVQKVQLGPYIPAGTSTIQLRWRYYDLVTGRFSQDWYAEVDDVGIGSCQPVAGGLVYGQVKDGNTGDGVVGAAVTDDQNDSVQTISNPDDPNLPQGSYLLFTPSGARTLTATGKNYTSATAQLSMSHNAVMTQDFVLQAGRIVTNPGTISLHVVVNSQKQMQLAVDNAGQAQSQFKLWTINAPAPATGTQGSGAALQQVHCDRLSAGSLLAQSGTDAHCDTGAATGVVPNDAPWTSIAAYPVPVMDNSVARDPDTGLVYSVGGTDTHSTYAIGYVYDPNTDQWSSIASMPDPVEKPAVAFINGKLYVADGWDSKGNPTAALQIYDPASDTWSTGPDNPNPLGGGASAAVLEGKLYLIGGCPSGIDCGATTVEVYDPGTQSWSSGTDYPNPISWESCGSINDGIYCAGGVSSKQAYADGYAYDPSLEKWTPIAAMPLDLWGSGYVAANGQLLVSGGSSRNGTIITNQGYAYDPNSNSWTALPNSNASVFRAGSACGFYKIGGSAGGGGAPVTSGEVLPGYDDCGKPPSIPWLTVAPESGTVAAGASDSLALTFDGTGQQEFTTSQAYLKLTGNTPYPASIVPIQVTWDPQPVALYTTAGAQPDSVKKGQYVIFLIEVVNMEVQGDGDASQVILNFPLPAGLNYVPQSGAGCSVAARVVTCDMGDLARGDRKAVTLVAHAEQNGTFQAVFTAQSREPQDADYLGQNVNSVSGSVGSSSSGDKNGGIGAVDWPVLGLLAALGLLAGLRRRKMRVS